MLPETLIIKIKCFSTKLCIISIDIFKLSFNNCPFVNNMYVYKQYTMKIITEMTFDQVKHQ